MPLIDELLTIFRGAGVGDVRTPRGSRPTWYGPVDVAPPPFPAPTRTELTDLKDSLSSCEPTTELCKALNNLGLIGCATTRRISALATQLRIPSTELNHCIKGLAKRCKEPEDPCLDVPRLPLDPPRAPRERILPSTGLMCPEPSNARPTQPQQTTSKYAMSELERIANGIFDAVVKKRPLNPRQLAQELARAVAIACSPALSQSEGMAENLLTLKRRLNVYAQKFPNQLWVGPYLDTINSALDRLKGGRSPVSAREAQRRQDQLRDRRNAGRRIRFANGRRR